MKCLRCNLVNPASTNICKRCQSPLETRAPAFLINQFKIYRDSRFLVIENTTALPKRCYRCNSRDIVAMKTQTLEYVPALDQALEFAVGQLVPIPLPGLSSPRRQSIELELAFCRRHRTYHRTFYKAGWGIFIFGVLCFAVGIGMDNLFPNFFGYAMITAVAALCLGMLLLYVEKEKEIVSKARYNAPYFWVKGFGEDYLSAFPPWTNSARSIN